MPELSPDLLASIRAGDCVLWTGVGLAALAGSGEGPARPSSWPALLTELAADAPEERRDELAELVAAGELAAVLDWLRRERGRAALDAVLDRGEIDDGALGDAALLAALPWRACLATAHAELIAAAHRGAERPLVRIGDLEGGVLGLPPGGEPFLLPTPPSVDLRRDHDLRELVDEASRTRTLLLVGFTLDDPDLAEIRAILRKIPRLRTHYLFVPEVRATQAEALRAECGLEVVALPEGVPEGGPEERPKNRLAALLEALVAAVGSEREPSRAGDRLAQLELARVLQPVPLRVDLGVDAAYGVDPHDVDRLVEQLEAGGRELDELPAADRLRLGSVWLVHARGLDGEAERRRGRARRAFERVAEDAGVDDRLRRLAHFDLALLALIEGDEEAARTGLEAAAEQDRNLALVPPRYALETVRGWVGARVWFEARNRSDGAPVAIEVGTLGRPVSPSERQRFADRVASLAAIDHPALVRVRGSFSEGRVFGVLMDPEAGVPLARLLAETDEPLPLDRAFELIGPLMEVVAVAHDRGLVHRNLHPRHVLITQDGAKLRGFGFLPLVSWARPAIVRANFGYGAPELLAGAAPSPASDVYALAAMLYRCVTGRLPLGSVPPASSLAPGLDRRVDGLLAAAMHPDASERPDPKALRTELATVLTTPHRAEPAGLTGEAVPDTSASPGAAASQPPRVPEDPDDLDGWLAVLRYKSTHLPAREAVGRLERVARASQRWDQVAEVLTVRADLSQAEGEKVVLLRELAELCERQLDAPGSALDALIGLVAAVSINAQLGLVDDLLRLAEVTGRWGQVAGQLRRVAGRAPKLDDQLALLARAAAIFLEQAGDLDQALACYEEALDLEPENLELQRAALAAYRKADRPAELATGLLTVAELETGSARLEALVEAAGLLGELGEHDGALEAAELARAEDPTHDGALAASERWARELENWAVLAEVLAAQAEATLDDGRAVALRREAAELLRAQLDDELGAIAQYRRIIERQRDDGEAAEALVELLRPRLEASDGDGTQPVDGLREGLIDALTVLADLRDEPGAQAELLAETAGLLDGEADGGERAADCRERIVAAGLPVDDARVRAAVEGLERWYASQGDLTAVAALLEPRARAERLPAAERTAAWTRLHELATGELARPELEREALEALVELEPGQGRWRDLLIEHLSAAGEHERAEALLRERIDDADSPGDRASMLIAAARSRERGGELDEAERQVREALELDGEQHRGWVLLREVLEQRERPLEALEAQVRAAQTQADPTARVRELVAAGEVFVTTLDDGTRALPLLREAAELDPHHEGATARLVDLLVATDALAEAWPHAERRVAQVRAGAPDDRELNGQVHALAGRCALAVGEQERARELLRAARGFDPRNREVARTLADLELAAESWEGALKAYQGLVLQAGSELGPRVQAELYLRMGEARRGMGELGKANQMIERALELRPDYVDAARLSVELSEEPGRRADAQRRLIEVMASELAGRPEDDPGREARTQELLDRRLELAATLADALNRPQEAVEQMREVLAQRPEDLALLHRALDLYSSAEQWPEAVAVLDRLAELQADGPIQAKYRYAATSLVRAHLTAPEDAHGEVVVGRLLAVLAADPLHEKALAAATEALEANEDWSRLSKVLRARFKALPEDSEIAPRIELLDRLAELYEQKLDDRRTAMIAYEQAAALTRVAGEGDEARQAARRNKVIALSVQLGGDAIERGIGQVQTLIRDNPLDYDSYHRLVELYLKAERRDAAIAVSRTLRFLKQADEAELELAAELGDGYQPPRGSITRKQWREVLLADHPSTRLGDLFGLLWPVMATREGQTHAAAGLERGQRTSVTMQSTGVARWVAYMSQILDVPVPDLFLRDGEAGGFKVTALGDAQGVYPTLLAGDEAQLSSQPDAAIAFRVGRAVARAHPQLLASALMPSSASLRRAIYGAVALTHPQVAIPKEQREAARGWGEAISKLLPPARIDDLRKAVAKVIESGGADTKAWLRGCDQTSVRLGFLLADSLEVAARVILQGGAGAQTEGRELIKELVAFSVSGPYLELRRTLKIGR